MRSVFVGFSPCFKVGGSFGWFMMGVIVNVIGC